MLWQNKSYDLVSYLEIIIGIIALICLLSLLYLWYQPKCQNKFNNIVFLGHLIICFDLYLLVDKVAHLLMSFYQAYLHHLKYNIYDYALLSSDILLTVVLIFSTFSDDVVNVKKLTLRAATIFPSSRIGSAIQHA